jgi:hypothetical protein
LLPADLKLRFSKLLSLVTKKLKNIPQISSYLSSKGIFPWILIPKSEEMAFRAICVLVGVFICSICVRGSSQPQARVYLTFDGKKFDNTYKKTLLEVLFFFFFFFLSYSDESLTY